jgi:hypothetical protein
VILLSTLFARATQGLRMILKRRALLVAGAAVKRRRSSPAVDARAADTRLRTPDRRLHAEGE